MKPTQNKEFKFPKKLPPMAKNLKNTITLIEQLNKMIESLKPDLIRLCEIETELATLEKARRLLDVLQTAPQNDQATPEQIEQSIGNLRKQRKALKNTTPDTTEPTSREILEAPHEMETETPGIE